MPRRFTEPNRDQLYLLAPSVRDWLPPGHLVFLVEDAIDQLDISSVYAAYSPDERGGKTFSPHMMLWLMLYAWCRRTYSSRAIAKLALEDLGGRVIVGDSVPNFRTVNLFRLRIGDAMKSLFVESIRVCIGSGLVGLDHLGIDGTKLHANASMDNSNSLKVIDKQSARLEAEIDALLEHSRELDAAEDRLYGPDNAGPVESPELADRQKRRERLRQAKEALNQRAVDKERDKLQRWQNTPPPDRPKVKKPLDNPSDAEPLSTDQYNFVDPDSRVLKHHSGVFIQGYNAQIAVDGEHQVIVAAELTNCATDVHKLTSLLDQATDNAGLKPNAVLADKGYYSKANINAIKSRNIRACIPPLLPKAEPLSEPEGSLYRKRSAIVEPVFGSIKGNRTSLGFRAFLRRGLERCNQDWLMVCTAHNLCKYMQYG